MAHPIVNSGRFTYEALKKQLETRTHEKPFETFEKAYEGDFWQDGSSILLPDINPKNQQILKPQFERRYVSRNVVRECVERVSNALLGKAPNWLFEDGEETVDAQRRRRERRQAEIEAKKPPTLPVAPPAEGDDPTPQPNPDDPEPQVDQGGTDGTGGNELFDEVDEVLGEYWTHQALAGKIIEAFEKRLVVARGGLRVYIPKKFRQGERYASAKDFREAVSRIRVEFVEPADSRYIDDDAEVLSLVKYEMITDYETMDKVDVIEFSFVDDNDRTVVGTVKEGDEVNVPNANVTPPVPGAATPNSGVGDDLDTSDPIPENLSEALDLGGLTTFMEVYGRKPFVTEQLYKNNQLLNLALTCAGFNLVDNGFGEMVLTNVALETEEVTLADGSKKQVPKSIKRGGGAVNSFVGIQTVDPETGEETIVNPGVHFRDPTGVEAFKGGQELAYTMCLDEAGQRYALISGDAAASGEARIQALVDFYLKVKKYKPEIDTFGSWLLTLIVKLAAELCNQREKFKDFKVIFDCKITIAKLTPDERRLVIEMQEKGIISMETARVLLDIDDPDLEQELIDDERLRTQPTIGGQTVEDMTARVGVANSLTGTADLETRLRMSFPDLTEQQIKQMADRQRREGAVDDAGAGR